MISVNKMAQTDPSTIEAVDTRALKKSYSYKPVSVKTIQDKGYEKIYEINGKIKVAISCVDLDVVSERNVADHVFRTSENEYIFDDLDYARIEGTDGEDSFLVQNSTGVEVDAKSGDDVIKIVNSDDCTVRGGWGNDTFFVTSGENNSLYGGDYSLWAGIWNLDKGQDVFYNGVARKVNYGNGYTWHTPAPQGTEMYGGWGDDTYYDACSMDSVIEDNDGKNSYPYS